ncbi:MAG: helix-turn-helix domain-containing protein, partial [Opitutales bacterium]|nr:helix-turn-helix domain-containing protein [Opitutales bacterium]
MATEDGTPDKLPHVAFHPTWGEEAFALWHAIGKPGYELGLNPESRPSRASFHLGAEFYELDGLVFCHTHAAQASYARDQRRAKQGEADCITLQLPIGGGVERGVTIDQPFTMASDRISVRDWSHPFDTVSQQLEQLALMIPRERVIARDFLHERQPVITWGLRTPQGRVLASAMHTLWETMPSASASDGPALAAGILGLVNGLIAPDARPQLAHLSAQPLLGAMQRFLDERLSEPTLSADDLMAAFHCSRATIYRVFREVGGVHAYIRTQRLVRCFRDLRRLQSAPRRVYEVAERWGFTDISHFR